ncbi:hypothetical protein ACFL96_15505 [Thermoproteota archaeon]
MTNCIPPILPYGPQYLITHGDLIKMGIDGTQKMKSVEMSETSIPMTVYSPNATLERFEFFMDFEFIIYVVGDKKKKKRARVCRKTGSILLKSNESFEDIIKFDSKTIPNEPEAHIDELGYWELKESQLVYSKPDLS